MYQGRRNEIFLGKLTVSLLSLQQLGKRKELQNLLSNLKLLTQHGLLVLIKLNTMLANSNNTVNICSVDQGLGPAGLRYSGAPV